MNKIKSFFNRLTTKEFWLSVFHSLVWLMILMFVLDIASKWVVENNYYNWAENNPGFVGSNGIPLINGFLYVYLTHNTGAGWSFLANWGVGGRIVLLLISVIMSGALTFIYIKKYKSLNNWYKVGLALMIPGAVGNLVDRALYWGQNGAPNGVIDWISFHFGNYVFPTFNIADASLVVGAIVLIIALVIDLIKEARQKALDGEYSISPKEREKLEKEKSQVEEKVDEEKIVNETDEKTKDE